MYFAGFVSGSKV
jgi:hypothetical protein